MSPSKADPPSPHSRFYLPSSFHEVLNALVNPIFYSRYVSLPTSSTPCPPEIRQVSKFWPFFKDGLGAIDGTHILAHPSADIAPRFRNRKGQISQNVLACCSFDLRFTYILSGWEGSAADGHVFNDAVIRGGLKLPEGKYLLADAGFGDSPMLLTPYRGVRYHLREWGVARQR